MTVEIVSLVTDVKGCQPMDLEPLSNVTDPDALENLIRETAAGEFEIGFDYEGGRLSISSDGTIEFDLSVDRST
ncbi:hypothetical protein GL213_09660 [Halogeometricum borinquense]|nr:HalOD1 output domain-containing protein [Halogeometricum borinquense]ELY23808.1 hypothetical protein C499_18694 [Halogeometricum borinquense DSM 11551]QIB73880.1 hypothetical protein G3I44_05985 [Halogeometricum borinquense]QIQ76758.1 hypothetical protein GL213_09660 [Halogeometricum borinquense]RYJ13518.1 hypothetical protein ELS19_05795 [Halogeometricum borinquense]